MFFSDADYSGGVGYGGIEKREGIFEGGPLGKIRTSGMAHQTTPENQKVGKWKKWKHEKWKCKKNTTNK